MDTMKNVESGNEVITGRLFLCTQKHHRKCLRRIFLKYYEPVMVDGNYQHNPYWTIGVTKKVMKSLRLHLTWVLKGEVFHWTDEQIGKKILKIFQKVGKVSVNTFVKHVRMDTSR